MPSSSRADLGGRILGALPAAAAATAEGAWVAVWYAALGAASRSARSLGLAAFVAAAAVGLVLARQRWPGEGQLGSRWARLGRRLTLVLVVLVGAGFGLLLERPTDLGDPGAWASGLVAMIGHGEVGGLLLGFAAWRGTRHADPERDDLVTAGLLGWGAPLLAVPWLVGGLRPAAGFVEDALVGTLTFVAASLLAIGLTRLEALDRSVGLDWRRNRAWLALLVSIVVAASLAALPAAVLLGASVDALLGVLLGPLTAGAGAAGRVVGALGGAVGSVLGPVSGPGPAGEVGGGSGSGGPVPDLVVPGLVGGIAAVVFGLAIVVIGYRLWLRLRGGRPSPIPPPAAVEERRFRLPELRLRLPLPDLAGALGRRRPSQPRTASEAYLALVDRLEGTADLARHPGESPSGHARRLRMGGLGSLRFDLLAADVALERFAGRRLSRTELRRALVRAREPRLGRRAHGGRSRD